MAGSFFTVKAVSVLIVTGIARRGYVAGSQAKSTLRSGASNVMLKKGSKESANTSWGPDPVTGYYRPENHVKETDAAELRQIFVSNKTTTN